MTMLRRDVRMSGTYRIKKKWEGGRKAAVTAHFGLLCWNPPKLRRTHLPHSGNPIRITAPPPPPPQPFTTSLTFCA